MLRDAIADRIVERARALADLRMPSDAFLKTPLRWKSGEHTRTVYPLRPELTGFEMVVASANNGAVENISKEIPARAALAPKWRDEVDYFVEQGIRLLKGTSAWGTVAAHLGNKTNRIAFVNRLWHGKYLPDDQALPQGPDLPPVKGKGWQETGHGLSHLLSSYRNESQTGVWWNAKEPGWTSVQQVADRVTRYGTTLPAGLPDGSTEVWVGAPLRVHCRCENPMFTVSNAIAYDGLMVNGTHYPDPYAYPPRSSWVHVASAHFEGHWVPEEGLALHSMLKKLRDHGIDLDQEAYVISPFRAVVAGARWTSRPFMKAGRVGTVHTTQGKEANVVILVLGTDPRTPGARTWAAKRPNLLNVAVSRAKRRLCVIGNHELWTQERFFTDLGERLPRYDWSAKPADTFGG
ncbi:DEAD/DEAH box helicase [Kitasatospora sp. NPDC004614]|uniref:DEAD/DEAH box helicase n=1 Tax=unclassified Kitasatospora TaxID=2633591 RepID=UPI0036871C7E